MLVDFAIDSAAARRCFHCRCRLYAGWRYAELIAAPPFAAALRCSAYAAAPRLMLLMWRAYLR